MATIRLPSDFKEFLQLLNSEQVEYLLVGGYAVAYHGYPRATGGIDIWVALNRSNAAKLVNVLQRFRFNSPDLSVEMFLERERIVRLGVPPFRIEILTTISGVNFAECYAERIVDVMDEVEINFIHLKYLKVNKRASGRLKDLSDLEHLP